MKGRHTPDEIIRTLGDAEFTRLGGPADCGRPQEAGRRSVATNVTQRENTFHSARLFRDPVGGRLQSRYSDRRAPVSPFLLVVTAFAIALLPFETRAQEASAQMVRGVVREHETGGPVFDAVVTFTRQAAVDDIVVESTDSSGVFAASLPDPGAYEVAVRHAGFRPVTQLIDVASGQEVVLEIRLSPVALEPIRVVSRRRGTGERIGGYYDRLNRYGDLGIGRFVTREQIDRDAIVGSPVRFLRSVPFVTLKGSALTPVPYFRHHGQLCQPRLFYDGAPVDAEMLGDVVGQRLEGIEVYRGHAQAPGTWSDPSGCGVILFWSRPDEDVGGVQWLRGGRGVLAIGLFLLGGYLVVR